MKKNIFMLLMIASLVIATGLLAQRSERQYRPKSPQTAAPDFGLSDEQMAKIEDLELKLEKELIPLKTQIPAIEANIKQELVAAQFNQSKVKSLIDQKVKIHSEMRLKQIINQRAVRDLLTPEQQKKFDLQVLKRGMRQHRGPGMMMRPHAPGADVPFPDLENESL